MNSITPASRPRSHLLLLGLIVVFAGGLRFFSLSTLGYWTDEFCTLSCAGGWGLQFDQVPVDRITAARPVMTHLSSALPASKIIPAMARDEAHPPLYFLLVRLWEALLGDSESAVRSLDVLFSLLAIVLLFFCAPDSIGSTAALWACLLMAVADPQIQFSQEARNYMPVVTFSLAALLAIQQLKCRHTRSAAILLAAALLAMMLTHYFAAGVAAALGIFALFSLRGRARSFCGWAFAGSAMIFCLAWGPFLIRQLPHFQGNYAWILDTSANRFGHVGINLCRVPWRLFAEMPQSTPMQITVEIAGGLFIAWLPILMVRRPELRIWGLWFTLSIGLIVLLDLVRSTAQLGLLRYSLFASPAMYVILAGSMRPGRLRFLPPAVAVAIALLSLPSAYIPAWKIDFRTPIQVISHRLAPRDGLVILGQDRIPDGIMYAAFQHYLLTMPGTSAVLTYAPDAPTAKRLQSCPQVWVVRPWPNKPIDLPGFVVEDRQTIPYFADMAVGRFKPGLGESH